MLNRDGSIPSATSAVLTVQFRPTCAFFVLAPGRPLADGRNDAIRQIGVSEVTYYRWRQEFGGLPQSQGGPERTPHHVVDEARAYTVGCPS